MEEIKVELNPEQQEVMNVDFVKGTLIDKVMFDLETGVPKFLREMAKFSRKNKVKSVLVMTINEDDHVDWMHIADNEKHLALAIIALDDMKDDLKAKLFNEETEETE